MFGVQGLGIRDWGPESLRIRALRNPLGICRDLMRLIGLFPRIEV